MAADVLHIEHERGRREAAKSFAALKFAMLDRANVDERLTHMDFRCLYYLASAVDQDSGIARRKQQVIADALGITRRAVQISIDRLSEYGYLAVVVKDGGSYTNGYRLLSKANAGLTFKGQKANAGSPFNGPKANGASPLARKRRTNTRKKANVIAHKGETPFAPILPFNSLDIPYGGLQLPDEVLGWLGEKLGNGVVISWFSKLRVTSVTDGVVAMVSAKKLTVTRCSTEYSQDLLDAWRWLVPSIERITIAVDNDPKKITSKN